METKMKIPEASCILKFIARRQRKKLGTTILTTGSPGKGKSYFDARALELWYWFNFGEAFPTKHICRTLEEAVLLTKNITRPGEGLMIEELSVLAGRRASLTKENRLWNSFMDTVRIKQLVIIANTPHSSFVDKHFILLSQLWVECLGVDFKKKVSIGKVLELQMSQHKSEPYMHKLYDDDGWPVDFVHLKKPSPYILEAYDKLKTENTTQLYEEIAMKMIALKNKRRKELGAPILSRREQEAMDLKEEGLTAKEAAERMGLKNVTTYYEYLQNARKKQ